MADGLAQPGTVLGDAYLDPGKVAAQHQQREGIGRMQQAKLAADKSKAKKPPVEPKWEHPGWMDAELISQQKEKYLETIGDASLLNEDNGGTNDPYNPAHKAGIDRLKSRARIDDLIASSKQQHEHAQNLIKTVMGQSDKFQPGALNEINAWWQLPLTSDDPNVKTRMNTPPPTEETLYDLTAQIKSDMELVEANKRARAWVGETQKGSSTVEEYDPEELISKSDTRWANDPYFKPAMMKKVATLTDKDRLELLAMIDPKAGPWAGMDISQAMGRLTYLEQQKRVETKTAGEVSAATMGFGGKKAAAEYFVDLAKGVQSGNFEGFQPVDEKAGKDLAWDLFGWKGVEKGQYEIAEAPKGVVMSPKVHSATEKNSETGESTTTKFKDELLGFVKDKEGRVAIITTFNKNNPEDIPEKDWYTKDAFKDKLLIAVANNNSEVGLGETLEAAKRKGEEWSGTGTFKDKNSKKPTGSTAKYSKPSAGIGSKYNKKKE